MTGEPSNCCLDYHWAHSPSDSAASVRLSAAVLVLVQQQHFVEWDTPAASAEAAVAQELEGEKALVIAEGSSGVEPAVGKY